MLVLLKPVKGEGQQSRFDLLVGLANANARIRSVRYIRPFLCAIALLACVSVANPFVNSAFNDDWSYSDVALKLAETGSFHYNGWGSPTIVFQSIWAALWIRIFGFSFNLLRIVTLPFSAGFILLSYALARKSGLRRNFALFTALSVAVSPLFIPLAATFMTEPYACFSTILCIYATVESAESQDTSFSTRWLWILAVSGILGGSDRQTVWVAPLVLIPYLFWKKRSDQRFGFNAGVAYATCLAALALVVHYFSQRYGPMELTKRQLFGLVVHNGHEAVHLMVSILLAGLLMSLPALLCLQPLWKRIRRRQILSLVLLCVLGFDYLRYAFGPKLGVVPFFGNILTPFGILDLWIDGLGFRPLLLNRFLCYGLTIFLLFCLGTWIYLVREFKNRDWFSCTPIAVSGLFACAYIPLLFPGALLGFNYDRYVLPLVPLMIILILLPFQSVMENVPVTAWVCLTSFATYGIVTTHDYFATLRARAEAGQQVVRQGLPRERVSIGLEHDAWMQLQLAGKMRPTLFGDEVRFDIPNRHWFWLYTTSIQPDYVAVSSRRDSLPKGQLLYVPFTAWTFPFKRAIAVVKREELPN